jgi:acyl-CoA thioester hydrolase
MIDKFASPYVSAPPVLLPKSQRDGPTVARLSTHSMRPDGHSIHHFLVVSPLPSRNAKDQKQARLIAAWNERPLSRNRSGSFRLRSCGNGSFKAVVGSVRARAANVRDNRASSSCLLHTARRVLAPQPPLMLEQYIVETESKHPLLAKFPVVVRIPVQWGDQDAFGHVNNIVPHRWFESARIALFDRLGLLELKKEQRIGPILAANSCDYRRQINFPDTVQVGIRVARIGRTSITFEHAIVSEVQDAVVTEGTSTTVVLDYQTQKPHPVPDSVREAIASLEGRTFE